MNFLLLHTNATAIMWSIAACDIVFKGLWVLLQGSCWPEHVSGAWAAKKPLLALTYFCNPRSPLRFHSATSRSALSSAPSFFCNARSPFRSTRFSARSAPLTLRSHALLLIAGREELIAYRYPHHRRSLILINATKEIMKQLSISASSCSLVSSEQRNRTV